jgi:hypothetical protein
MERARAGEEIVISDGDGTRVKLAGGVSSRARTRHPMKPCSGRCREDELKRWHGDD